MTQRTLSYTATALLGLLGSTSALALESGFYMGAVAGQSSIDVSKEEYDQWERDPRSPNFASSLDDSDTALGVFFGGQFGRWAAVETQIMHLGKFRYKATQTVPNVFLSAPRAIDTRSESKVESAAATLTGIVTIPFGQQFAVGIRLGVAFTATDTNFEYEERRGNVIIESFSDKDFEDFDDTSENVSATYGFNFEWDPTRHFGLRLEYQRIADVGEDDENDFGEASEGTDVDLVSLNVIGRF